MLAYVNIVTNSSDFFLVNKYHYIDFESTLLLPWFSNMGFKLKRTALLIQAHGGSLYAGRELQQIHILTWITAVFGPNRELSIQPSLATCSQCFTLSQLWHKSDCTVHQFNLLKQHKITLAKIESIS